MQDTTYDRLRDMIFSNEIGSSPVLTENNLAELLGVSRTPVREALKRLEQDGLVERSGRSVRVRERSPEEILEIYEVRITLEGVAARAAATRHTQFDLSRLEAIHDEMVGLETDDVARLVSWNNQFHEALWHASHNSTLIDVMTRLIVHLHRYPQSTLGQPGRWVAALEEHAELIKAIRAADGDRACTLAADHMTLARDTRLKMYAKDMGRAPVPSSVPPME